MKQDQKFFKPATDRFLVNNKSLAPTWYEYLADTDLNTLTT